MGKKFLFPIFLSLEGKHCLVVGFGKTGIRKLKNLLKADPCSVLVLDTIPWLSLPEDKKLLLGDDRVKYENHVCTINDIKNCFLVIAATNDKNENARIAMMCAEAEILCNSVSDPQNGSFILPSCRRVNNLSMAISTDGTSPAFAKKLCDEQRPWLEQKSLFLQFMGKIREIVLSNNNTQGENELIFNKIINSHFEEWFERGELYKCERWLEHNISVEQYKIINKILDDLT